MPDDTSEQLGEIERKLEDLLQRVERLEGSPVPAATPTRPPVTVPAPARSTPESPAPSFDVEELLGGRLLGWAGGLAIVLGAAFFLVMAVSRGWIDEPTRVLLAFAGSTALLGAGLYLYERQGQTQAALAAVAAAIAALYASDTAATQLYDLVAPAVGLIVALLIGAAATAIAVRWNSRVVAGIGIVGALLAPVLVDAGTSAGSLAFMAIALVSATAVLLWRRWDWLAAASFLASAPQLVFWIDDTYKQHLARTLVVLALFWLIYVVAAIGYEVRVPVPTLRMSSASLLLVDAVLVSGAGYGVLHDRHHGDLGTAWVIGLALVYVLLGAAGLRGRISDEIGSLLAAVGLGLSAIALGLALSGPVLVLGWSVEAVVLAWVAHRTGRRRAELGVAFFLALAAGHVLTIEAPPSALLTGVDSLAQAAVAIAAVGLAALAASLLLGIEPRTRIVALRALAAVAAVYLPSVVIVDLGTTGDSSNPGQTPQLLLSALWGICGLGALVAGLLRDERALRLAGLLLFTLAVAKVFLFDLAKLESAYRVLSFIAIGLLLLTGAFAYQRLRRQPE